MPRLTNDDVERLRFRWSDLPQIIKENALRAAVAAGRACGCIRGAWPGLLPILIILIAGTVSAYLVLGVLYGPAWIACHVAGGDPLAVAIAQNGDIAWKCRGLGT